MSTFPTKILLATDGSAEAELAGQTAIVLAQSTDSELHVLTVGGEYHPRYEVTARPELLEETLQELEREAKETLDEQVRKIEEAGGSVTQHHLGMGNPAEKIAAQAEEIGAGLIAMGSRGLGGIRRALMGSVSDSVVRRAPCPVLVTRKEGERVRIFPTKVLLATDGSKEATLAAKTAADMTQKTGSELHIVHVKPAPLYVDPSTDRIKYVESAEENVKKEAQQLLDAQVEQIEATNATVAQTHIRLGRADEEIIALADEIDTHLIVVGSRGLGGMPRALMGSVSDSIVRHARCPVMVVRGVPNTS